MTAPLPPRPSLLWKILLSTALIITLVLAVTAWFVEEQTVTAMTRDLHGEIRSGFQSYESLWKARADNLRSISTVLSTMSDVRAAFQTSDRATIRDTAKEIWSKVSTSDAFFVVADPAGGVIASLGGQPITGPGSNEDLPIVRAAAKRFPAQAEGFSVKDGQLYEVVVTPVYVQTGTGAPGLLNVLVAGFLVDHRVAANLKQRTGGSDFIFRAPGARLISTMQPGETAIIASHGSPGPNPRRMQLPGGEFVELGNTLPDIDGRPLGDVLMVRSYASLRHDIRNLQQRFIWIWGTAILAAAIMSLLIARRILRPIHDLDRAAARIAEQDYSVRVPESGNDEVARLARSFNQMSTSIQDARDELIRQERLNTIGRLASSIVHDLRNPLASIYGGAEMLVDGDLSEEQTQRVARNIYRSSRVIKDLLQELSEISRGRVEAPEICALDEIAGAAVDAQRAFAEQQNVSIASKIDPGICVLLERGRMERVFLNLLNNALEAMPDGGAINITAEPVADKVIVRIADTGPGIPRAIRDRLFQPFVTAGKNGLGLGLALSRQAARAHGGDLWVEDAPGSGACFCIRLPRASTEPSSVDESMPDFGSAESHSLTPRRG
jgi:signal transduction histidine kinase